MAKIKNNKAKNTENANSKNNAAKKVEEKQVVKEEITTKEEVVQQPKKEKTKKVEEKQIVKKEKKKESLLETLKENIYLVVLCIICVLLIVNIILIVIGHSVKLQDGKEIVGSIDGKTVTAEQLFDELKQTYGSTKLIEMFDKVIIEKTLSKEDIENAKKSAQEQVDQIREQYEGMGYKWDEVLSQYGYENETALLEEIMTSKKAETIVKEEIKKDITDENIKEYYDKNIFNSYSAKHILISPETNDDMSDEEKAQAEEAALNKAKDAITRLNNGEEWKNLVSELSTDEGSKENEGLIENFTKGDVVDEFFNAVENLEDGAYTSEPVKSSYGYHIILRVSKTDKDSMEDMKEELIEKIISQKLSEDTNLYDSIWAKVRKSYNLDIKDTVISNNYNKSIKG